MSDAEAAGVAYDATVDTASTVVVSDVTALEQDVIAADAAVEAIEEKMVGWERSLADARAVAEAARQRLNEWGN